MTCFTVFIEHIKRFTTNLEKTNDEAAEMEVEKRKLKFSRFNQTQKNFVSTDVLHPFYWTFLVNTQ